VPIILVGVGPARDQVVWMQDRETLVPSAAQASV